MSIKIGDTILAKSSTYHPDLLDTKWSDHILDNVSWLRADTFSWQYGNMYPKVYQHLYSDIAQQGAVSYAAWKNSANAIIYTTSENPQIGDTVYRYSNNEMVAAFLIENTMEATSLYIRIDDTATGIYNREISSDKVVKDTQSETIANITVRFYQADDGHKIVAPEYAEAVRQIYEATGLAWYYIVDTVNKRFKLPRKRSSEVVRTVNYGEKGYKLYADGWVEQWGTYTGTGDGMVVTELPLAMKDTNYQVTINRVRKTDTGDPGTGGLDRRCFMTNGYTQTSFRHWGIWATYPCTWKVCGRSNQNPKTWEANEKYLYFYVGDYTQASVENIAGINTELFNGKADIEVLNRAVAHVVTECQNPTAENNYTWYRKYEDGWVEQGQFINGGSWSSYITTITLPILMSDANYTAVVTPLGSSEDTYITYVSSRTQSTLYIRRRGGGDGCYWYVAGIAA